MFEFDFPLTLSKLPRSFNLAADEVTRLRSDLLAFAQFHIDLYLHSLPGRISSPEWVKFGDSTSPLLPSIGLQISPQFKLSVVRAQAGDPFSLLDRNMEPISEEIRVRFGDIVVPFIDGSYLVPHFAYYDIVTVRIESHPHRFFLFQLPTRHNSMIDSDLSH